ncbi:MAG: ABC transporter ATP-binding protein [Thermoprotei archaeon]|nr:MAG: ABC transporter ATP-binding protein [Thermoprotei archaeon]
MALAVEVEDLWFKYQTSKEWVLRGVNLKVEKGEYVGLLGPASAGKTTLCMTFNGLIPHYVKGVFRGVVRVFGVDTSKVDLVDLAKDVQVVFQEAASQLIMSSVEEELVYPLVNLRGLTVEEARAEALRALRELGVAHLASRNPQTCSGGEKQRILLALMLALKPKLLVVDEATSDLDPEISEVFYRLSKELNEEGTTVIVVTQDTDRLVEVADRVILMERGLIVNEGDPREVMRRAQLLDGIVRTPQVVEYALELRRLGLELETLPLTVEEVVELVRRARSKGREPVV